MPGSPRTDRVEETLVGLFAAALMVYSVSGTWIAVGYGSIRFDFSPLRSNATSFVSIVLVVLAFGGIFLHALTGRGIEWAGFAGTTWLLYAVINWLFVFRFISIIPVRVVKTEAGSVLRPNLALGVVAALLLIAAALFSVSKRVNTANARWALGDAVRMVGLVLVASLMMISRDLPWVYAKSESFTWAVGGAAIPGVGEVMGFLGLSGAVLAISLIFVRHVSVEISGAVIGGMYALGGVIFGLSDHFLISAITRLLPKVGDLDADAFSMSDGIGPWFCSAVGLSLLGLSIFSYVSRTGSPVRSMPRAGRGILSGAEQTTSIIGTRSRRTPPPL